MSVMKDLLEKARTRPFDLKLHEVEIVIDDLFRELESYQSSEIWHRLDANDVSTWPPVEKTVMMCDPVVETYWTALLSVAPEEMMTPSDLGYYPECPECGEVVSWGPYWKHITPVTEDMKS